MADSFQIGQIQDAAKPGSAASKAAAAPAGQGGAAPAPAPAAGR
jgi:hypothetical protein